MKLKVCKTGNKIVFSLIALALLLATMLALPAASAGFLKGNQTADIQSEYSPYDIIKGWINISIVNESVNSQISTGFEDSISLVNIIQKNNLSQSISCTNATCSSNNKYVKIQLDSAEFRVPSVYGNYTLKIFLADSEIFSQKISVSKIPVITALSPTIVPAAIIADFAVYASSPENLTFTEYAWNFGDGSTVTTAVNKASHAYSGVGQYALKITIKDSKGQATSKEFAINVISPAAFINDSIKEKKGYMQNISNAIALFPDWYKEFVSAQLNITSIDSQLNILQQDYNSATATAQYIDIAKSLAALKTPKKLIGIIASGLRFAVIPESIELEKLKSAGAGDYKADKSAEYKNAISAWFAEKIESTVSFEAISAELDSKEVLDIATKIKLKIKAGEKLNDIYLVVKKSPAGIKFKDASGKDVSGGTAVTFSGLSANAEKEIEFIIAGGASIEDIFSLIFLSPKLSELNLDLQIEPCNSNKVCEKDKGEDWKNCRSDCKPVGLIILYIFLILVGAFIAYIILQEWYKKYYESSLFKNKNDLYNLLAFIENANKQGLKESEIAGKLKEKGWKGEQIAYALKKHKGQRVGMWEIPLFKGMENKKIRQEIMKRAPAQSAPPSISQFKP